MAVGRLRRVANPNALRLRLNRWLRRVDLGLYRASWVEARRDALPRSEPSPLPPGAAEVLRADHPRLADLARRYRGHPAAAFSRWSELRLEGEVEIARFRADSQYLFQARNTPDAAFALSADYVARHGKLGLLDLLGEDGMFGARTIELDGRLVSRDLLDSALEIETLAAWLGSERLARARVLDVGAGYGRLAHRLCAWSPELEVLATDAVPLSTFLCEYYLGFRGCAGASVAPLDEAECALGAGRFDVALNVHSFAEMPRSAVLWWLRAITDAGVAAFARRARRAGSLCARGRPLAQPLRRRARRAGLAAGVVRAQVRALRHRAAARRLPGLVPRVRAGLTRGFSGPFHPDWSAIAKDSAPRPSKSRCKSCPGEMMAAHLAQGCDVKQEGSTMRGIRYSVVIAALCAVLGSGAAFAVDGVIEINDTSIVAAGGYPYAIPAAGSYVLTGDLIPPGATGALVLGASNVEIDLNGFTITSTGGGGAIGIDSAGFSGLTVRGGVIDGFGGAAIAAGSESKVIETKLSNNGAGVTGAGNCLIVMNTVAFNAGGGVNAQHCKIENNVITSNAGVGITGGFNVIVHNRIGGNTAGGITGFANTIQQNVITGNTSHGISDGAPPGPPAPVPPPPAPGRTNIIGNTISDTVPGPPVGGRGISFLVPVLISDNTISGNATNGIFCGAGCVVKGNSVNTNNLTGAPGAGGVTVAAGSTVSQNSISYNTGFGLTLPAPATASYTHNTITGNTGPNVVSPPTITGGAGNVCAPMVCP